MVALSEKIVRLDADDDKIRSRSELDRPSTDYDSSIGRENSDTSRVDIFPITSSSDLVESAAPDVIGRKDSAKSEQRYVGTSIGVGTELVATSKPPNSREARASGRQNESHDATILRTTSESAGNLFTSAFPRLSSYETLEESLKSSQKQPSVHTAPLAQPDSAESVSSNGRSSSAHSAPPKLITTVSQASVSSSPLLSSRKHGSGLRRGKWTVEEEAYVARVIQDFNSGYLDAPAGTTLRTFLSEKLQCDPMRITKKFTGNACIGKRVFHPAVRTPNNAASVDRAQSDLESLERRWRRRMELQQRESAKKAAASAAAAAASTHAGQNVVAQTASWLDRAQSVLQDPGQGENDSNESDESNLVNQMQEVQRLIHEGPGIRQTSAGITTYLDQSDSQDRSSPNAEPADKRLRTGAEDAEALVGFLRSVRASHSTGEEL